MEISKGTAGPVPNPDHRYNALTREKLFLLNLENNNAENLKQQQQTTTHHSEQPFNTSSTTTPELSNSSSSSSLNSSSNSDDGTTDVVATGNESNDFYKFYNGSDSSIATIVQRKLSSTNSDSTLNLENSGLGAKSTQGSVVELNQQQQQQFKIVPTNATSIITDDDDDISTTTSEDHITSSIPRSLKSSLKLPSLKRSRSLPSTKTVRFSTDLTKIKTFNEYAKPSSISLENSPDQSPPHYINTNGRAYFDLKEDLFTNHTSSAPWFDHSSSSSEDDEDDELDYFYRTPSPNSKNKWKLKSMNFDLFRQSDPQSFTKLISLNILKDSITGLVQVLNLSFEKQVEVKFTVDSWNSIYIVNATYDCSLDSTRDQFKFEINLNNSLMINSKKSKNQPINIELCVKFSTPNGDFYDNNHGSNFKFQIVSNKNTNRGVRRSSQNYQHHRPSSSTFSSIPFNTSTNSGYDDNFASAILSPSTNSDYTSNENYTTSRYFSDDTDYFNTKYFKDSKLQPSSSSSSSSSINAFSSSTPWSSSTSSSTVSSISSNASTTSNSSNETIKVLGNNNESINNINSQSLQKSRQHYNEFLKKYCFFKSEDAKKNNLDESVFIR